MTTDLPVVDPPDDPPEDGRRVVGVVLAAGTSSRYGAANKLLTTVDGAPMVRRSTEALLAADLDAVVAVVGHEVERVRAALDDAVPTVDNDRYAAGQATSVATGVRAARDRDADAIVFALGDMPWVDPASVDALRAAYAAGAGDALAAAVDGERGNPVLFDRRYFDALVDGDVDGDGGGREILLSSEAAALVETGDPGVRRDVDRPDDVGD